MHIVAMGYIVRVCVCAYAQCLAGCLLNIMRKSRISRHAWYPWLIWGPFEFDVEIMKSIKTLCIKTVGSKANSQRKYEKKCVNGWPVSLLHQFNLLLMHTHTHHHHYQNVTTSTTIPFDEWCLCGNSSKIETIAALMEAAIVCIPNEQEIKCEKDGGGGGGKRMS